MDILNPADRAVLAAMLHRMFDQMGYGERFVIIAMGADGSAVTVGIDRNHVLDPIAVINALSNGGVTDKFTL